MLKPQDGSCSKLLTFVLYTPTASLEACIPSHAYLKLLLSELMGPANSGNHKKFELTKPLQFP